VTSCQKDAQEDNYRQCLTVRHRYCTNLQSDASSLTFKSTFFVSVLPGYAEYLILAVKVPFS